MIVVWRITERCNLSCAFCAYDRRLVRARRNALPADVRRIGQLLGDLRASGERVLVSWLGGEPLLWSPLFKTSRWLRDRFSVETSATTNGTTLHRPRTRASIIECFSELTVSVDGFAAFHNQVRGWNDGWARLRESVTMLAAERTRMGAALRLRANIVLMHDNAHDFADLCDAIAEWGVDEITFNQLGARDRPEFYPAHRLQRGDIALVRAQLPELRARLAARGVQLCGSDQYLERIVASTEGRALPVSDCRPGETFLFVDESGHIAPCSFTGDELGQSHLQVEDLRQMPLRFAGLRDGRLPAACGDCPSTRVFAKFGT